MIPEIEPSPFALPDMRDVMPAGHTMTSDGSVLEHPQYPKPIGYAIPVGPKITESVPGGIDGALPEDTPRAPESLTTDEEVVRRRMGDWGINVVYDGVEIS